MALAATVTKVEGTYREDVQMSADNVKPAGEGLTDEEMVEQVTSQTASDLKNSAVFEREADGAATDTEAAKATADELEGD